MSLRNDILMKDYDKQKAAMSRRTGDLAH